MNEHKHHTNNSFNVDSTICVGKTSLPIVNCQLSTEAGFTLAEMIMIMVIIGILGLMGSQFIVTAFKGFHGTDTRMTIYEEGKAALVRMERELHHAIPNAVNQASETEIQFGTIAENDMDCVSGTYTETFLYTEKSLLGTSEITEITDIYANVPNSSCVGVGVPSDSIISIYNTRWSPDFLWAGGGTTRLYKLSATYASYTNPIKLDGGKPIQASSPHQRFFIVDQAIQYRLDSGVLYRSVAPVDESNSSFSFGHDYPLANDVFQTDELPIFDYSPATLSRNAVVSINFTINRDDESVSFQKEVHVRNVP